MVQPPRARLSLVMGLGLTFLSVAVARALLAGAGALGALRSGAPFPQALEAASSDVLLTGVCQLAGLLTALGVGVGVVHGPEASREALGVRATDTRVVICALVAGLALSLPAHEAVNLLVDGIPWLARDVESQWRLAHALAIDGVLDALVVPLVIVAIPAVFEELLFRGLLQPSLSRRYGSRVGLIATALLFGAAHLEPLAIAYATALGLLLGLVRARSSSVMPAIAMHGAFNAVPVLLAPSLVRIEGFNVVSAEVRHVPLGWVVGSAAVAAAAWTLLSRLTEPSDGG